MNKIIGFLITKENNIHNIDFFNVGLQQITIKHNDYNIYIWGIGNIQNYKINDKYSLAFPLNDDLLDRNVLISFENDNIIVENDWLGSIPVFYNPKEKIVSTISNFCLKDKKIDNEGLINFCEFGYSVFEQTMFEDVKFMRYFSRLVIKSDKIVLEYKDDPATEYFPRKESKEEDVINLMQEYVLKIENILTGDIILPTSGGYDSRLLNYLVKDKTKIKSFTYGISKKQSKSTEVVNAKKISEIYRTQWEQIELKEFNRYIDEWFSVYGFSTHLHGMYHIEFYTNILKDHSFKTPTFLSGIVGDAWSESGKFKDINAYEDIINLGYSHGMNLDLKYLKIPENNMGIKKTFYESNSEYFKSDKLKAIFSMRTKLILISYLTQIPEYFGLPVWTPFLNFNIVSTTLNIDDSRRKDRAWQQDFFRKVGLNLEEMNLKSAKTNKLDYEISKNSVFEPIDGNLMNKYIKEGRLVEINSKLKRLTFYESLKNKLLDISKIGGLLTLIGFKNEYLKYLYEYYVIKTIEKSIKL